MEEEERYLLRFWLSCKAVEMKIWNRCQLGKSETRDAACACGGGRTILSVRLALIFPPHYTVIPTLDEQALEAQEKAVTSRHKKTKEKKKKKNKQDIKIKPTCNWCYGILCHL